MATVEFPEALFESVHSGSCILCTGVGLASTAGMPTWDGLFSQMSEKLGESEEELKKLIEQRKLLTVAGHLERKLGQESCVNLLTEAYGKEEEPSEAHKILKEIPFLAALTTSYDGLVDQILNRNGASSEVYTYADGAVLRVKDDLKNFVLKMHGDVVTRDQPGKKLILSRMGFRRFISPNHAFRSFVEDLYRTHTMFLVGFNATDPDFILLLDQLLSSFRNGVTDHYALLSNMSEPEVEELYANFRLRVIPYDDGDDPAETLAKVLVDFRDQWRDKGAALPGPEDPKQRKQWLKKNLASVELRIDMVPAQGLELSESKLGGIHATAEKLDLSEVDTETLCRLGNVNLLLDDAAQAIKCYEAAIDQSPDMYEAHLNLHVALAEDKQLEKSFEHLEKAVELEDTLLMVPERYKLESVLGRGSTGSIYTARDTEEDRPVTIKVLRTSYLREHGSPEKWLKETEGVKELEHENLAAVYDVLLEWGKCIMITEGVEGKSLFRQMRDGILDEERATRILLEICGGLQHAHDSGIFHLDVMPSNIFIKDDGAAVLMDFRPGRARKGRHISLAKGAEGFIAPEILAGAGGDARSDVYSLGAILYYMISGQAPVGSFARLGELNPAARRYDSLINSALKAIPDERPQTVAAFAEALESKTGTIDLPEDEDDLMGWLGVLNLQPDHEKAIEALERLEASYREETDWESLVTLILGKVEFEADAHTREAMFRELATIFEKEENDPAKAFAALKEAFRDNSSSVELRKDLERLAGATGMWNELLQEYTQLVQSLRDPKVACDWWVRMGILYSHELGHDDYAIASFNQALALDTNRADAMAELREVVGRKGEHEEVVRLLKRQIELEEDTARKAELLKDLARTYIKDLEQEDDAVETFEKILEVAPTHANATAALQGLYRKRESWDKYTGLLKDQLGLTDDAAAQKGFRRDLAQILADELDKPDEAISQYQQLLETDPDDLDALKGLEKLYDATDRNEEYLQILDQRIEAAGDDKEKAALCRRMATEWEDQPDGKARAAEYLEKVVEFTGGDDDTFKALVRNYWALKEYEKLAAAYDRHINITSDSSDRAILFAALGKVYEDHLEQPNQAIETFNNLLAVHEDNKIATAALARLYESTGVWAQSVTMLEKLATMEEDLDAQVEVFHRIGVIQHENLNKDDEAEVSFSKALELKDDHIETMMALASLLRERKDFGKAARLLREAGALTANELEKVKRLYMSGKTYQDDLKDSEKAQEVFEELLVIDPEHVESGEQLLALYEKNEDWQKAETLLEMLVRKADPKDRAKLLDLNLRYGAVALKGEDAEAATDAYQSAYDLDPTSQEALSQLAGLLHEQGDHEKAGKLFQALLVHRRDTLESEQIVEVFCKLGDIKRGMGEESKALNMYEKALDIEPTNKGVLEQAIVLYKQKDDWESVLRSMKNILKGIEDDEARIELAEEIGDLLQEKLGRHNDAINQYKFITEIKPDHRRVLNKIMESYILQKKWDEAISAMGKIEDFETEPTHRSRLHYTAAMIFRDQLNRKKDAVHHLDMALSKDPTNRRAFDALKKLYTTDKNYKGLAKAYHLMLERLPEDTPKDEQEALWQELALICHDKLHDAKGAIVAYEVAAKFNPHDEERQERLAQLYISAGPDAYEKAILANQRRLKTNPLRQEAYKELRRLYAANGDYDKAWCVAAVLSILKKASDEEQALYEKHRSEEPRRVARKLSDDLWRDYLHHPKQSQVLSDVFSVIMPLVRPMVVRSFASHGLKAQIDMDHDHRPFAAVARHMCQVMDQTVGSWYAHNEIEGGRQLFPLISGSPEEMELSMLVHPKILQGESKTELHYWFAKATALLRPEYFLYYATPSTTVMQAMTLAFLKLIKPGVRLSGDLDQIDQLTGVFKAELPPAKIDAVASRADRLQAAATTRGIESWLEGVDLSCTRAGLLMCDDLETAARLFTTEPAVGTGDHGTQAKERLKELMLFAVSEEYFKLREMLGMQVG